MPGRWAHEGPDRSVQPLRSSDFGEFSPSGRLPAPRAATPLALHAAAVPIIAASSRPQASPRRQPAPIQRQRADAAENCGGFARTAIRAKQPNSLTRVGCGRADGPGDQKLDSKGPAKVERSKTCESAMAATRTAPFFQVVSTGPSTLRTEPVDERTKRWTRNRGRARNEARKDANRSLRPAVNRLGAPLLCADGGAPHAHLPS